MKMFSFWAEKNNTLIGEFKFKNFTQAFGFLAQVAILQEKHNHHALIENMYNKVTLTLTTHDAGNTVTEKDYTLAEAIEKILE
ncbi:MAG: 4a-hydroxytetrahydrobiopterin dehydratase [Alphaproteobacteria bacterium]